MEVLIPKRNGKGWLRVPAGHHACERTSDIERVLKCDVCGLDGTLTIECGSTISTYRESRLEFERVALPLISRWFGVMPGREVSFAAIDAVINPQNATSERPPTLNNATKDAGSAARSAD